MQKNILVVRVKGLYLLSRQMDNIYILKLNENKKESYTSALLRYVCNGRDDVCFLNIPKIDINNIIDTVCIILGRGCHLIISCF